MPSVTFRPDRFSLKKKKWTNWRERDAGGVADLDKQSANDM